MKECGLVKYGDIASMASLATDEEAKIEVDQRSVNTTINGSSGEYQST